MWLLGSTKWKIHRVPDHSLRFAANAISLTLKVPVEWLWRREKLEPEVSQDAETQKSWAQRAVELIPYAGETKGKLTAEALNHCHSQLVSGLRFSWFVGGVECRVSAF